ncbi:U3 small nucleolar RNA-associated protein 4 [Fulvia fulva]|uniref:U3 small nucleolar RNA-associated protein 4 n=1 Tax=Passalora fulva TaxID=5499 RepID=A0A9Q8L4Y0_PASFU|nr:U3 small nucleolar RNA-associated protein 4 [Fulvia fulva]KAK4636823.1 U3 small nucleolar RNA-associated protein 4 [Fulvia fulva]UJO10857.1 U3 small nucleolar RNA-associated protein 4 [Fulvia fulva]
MDVHRSRFVQFPAHPITAVAFSRSTDERLPPGVEQPALKLAIGRANGEIEIWNPLQGRWVQENVFSGDNKSLDGLAWTREPDETDTEGQVVVGQHRLFSIASSPAVLEWDLQRGQLKKKSTGNFSAVWCFAAQPSHGTSDPSAQELVAGCEDGTIVLLTTADNDLQFKKFLARVSGKKARCVSIAYQKRDRVVAGFMDSTIRVFDTRSSSVVRTMSIGAGIPGAPKNTIVWSVKALPNGDIISGDSNGEVVFWDGRSYSLTQRIKGHDSECLDVVPSSDGKTVFSGSLDGRIAVHRQSTNANGRRSWANSHHRKVHNGEVKVMSAFDSNGLSVVVSGGADPVPVAIPLQEYGKENNRPLPTVPQQAPVISARHARLLVSWWGKDINIWRISRRAEVETSPELQPPRRLVARITLNTKHNIRRVSISDDGKVLAASTNAEIKLFQLRRKPDADALGVRRLHVPKTLATLGARAMNFSPDSKWLAAVTPDSEVHIVRITADLSNPKHVRVLDKVVEVERQNRVDTSQSGFKLYDQAINQLAFSADSSVLAASDLSGHIDSWVLEGHEDPTAPPVDVSQEDSKHGDSDDSSEDSSDDDDNVYIFYGQHWTDNPAGRLIPKLDSAALILTFRPTADSAVANAAVNGNPGIHSTRHNPYAHSHELPAGRHLLWVMTASHEMYEFDVLAGKLSDWSRNNPTPVLPADFARLRDRVIGAVWDVAGGRERLWLYGTSWMFMLNVGGNLLDSHSRKRRKSEVAEQGLKRLKTSSGAGLKTPSHHREGLPQSLKRLEDGTWTEVALDRPIKHDEDVDMDEAIESDTRLALTRIKSTDDEDQIVNGGASQQMHQRTWWCTFKYRPILGVVPIADDAAVDEDKPLEVVVVERPLWDAQKSK